MPIATDYPYGFIVRGDTRQPRKLVDFSRAFRAFAACDERADVDHEAYLSAFCFGGAFKDHMRGTGSTARFAGRCWSQWLWFDIDRENPAEAIEPTRTLIAHITAAFDLPDGHALVFYSGAKGFHVGIPTAAWDPEPGTDFHRVSRRFAERIAGAADVQVDTAIYDKVRCFRAPNSRHPKTGLHKRCLLTRDLCRPIGWIQEQAQQPATFELPAAPPRSEPARELWAACVADAKREEQARYEQINGSNASQRLNRLTMQFIRGEGVDVGERQRRLYSAAANVAELGGPLNLCLALLEERALDLGLPPREVQRTIKCGWQRAATSRGGA